MEDPLPQQALESGRASFLWDTVWIAKMRKVNATDILPSPEQMLGDSMERLTLKYGGSIADQLYDDLAWIISKAHKEAQSCLDSLSSEEVVWVQGATKGYRKDMGIRPADFSTSTIEIGTAEDAERFRDTGDIHVDMDASGKIRVAKVKLDDLI